MVGLNSVMEAFSGEMCDLLKPVLFHPVMLFVAFAMVLQWQIGIKFESKKSMLRRQLHNEMVHTFGVGLIVLQIFYAPYLQSIIQGSQFTVSCFFILFDSLLSLVLNTLVGKRIPIALNIVMVENRYQDITVHCHRMFTYFWVQTALFLYFAYYVNNDAGTHSAEHVSILKWFIAVNLTQIAGADEAGTRFHARYWFKILEVAKTAGDKRDKIFGFLPVSFETHWRIKAFCDFMVNGIIRVTIMGLSPVVLAHSSPLDFIKDCLAIFFITKLDDYDDHRTFKKMLQILPKGSKRYTRLSWLRALPELQKTDEEDDDDMLRCYDTTDIETE